MLKDKHMKITLLALYTVGVWPLPFKHNNIIDSIYTLYGKFNIILFVLFIITEYCEIFFSQHDSSFFEIANNLTVSLLYVETYLKVMICRNNRSKKMVEQIRLTENIVLNGNNDTMKQIYMDTVHYNYKVNKYFMCLGLSTILPFFINPVATILMNPLTNYTEIIDGDVVYVPRPLPFNSWFPFDKYKYYGASFSLQVIVGCIGASYTTLTDIFFWSLILFGIGQLRILQYKIIHLKADAKLYAQHNGVGEIDALVCVLKKVIIIHQILIRYFMELNQSLNLLMLINFGLCSMQIGLIGFQIISTGLSLAQIFAIEYLVAMLIQMFLFYWFANEIIVESTNIASAVWHCDFYEFPLHLQKTLQIVMMRAQKPLTLKVGVFYEMSTTTAISILRMAYSYVALMRQFYN